MKLKLTLATLTVAALGASSAGLLAEDLGKVKVTYDKEVAARTNMPSREGTDPGNLTVTFDPAYTERTNMQRPVETQARDDLRDQAVMERTNMPGRQRSRSPAGGDRQVAPAVRQQRRLAAGGSSTPAALSMGDAPLPWSVVSIPPARRS
jgi:hypothetical protein